MIEFPKPVRLAELLDTKRVFDLFMIAHAENGFFTVDDAPDGQVMQFIHRSARHNEGAIIAIIDGPERVEAAISLQRTKLIYAKDEPGNYFWTDGLGFFVHPLHRRSRHWSKLRQFCRWWAEQCDEIVLLNLLPRDGFVEKERLFERIGKRVGASFLVGEGAAEKLRITDNARTVTH